MKKSINTILFDWDNTLVDSTAAINSALDKACIAVNATKSEMIAAKLLSNKARSSRDVFNALGNKQKKAAEIYTKELQSRLDKAVLFPGAKSVLDFCVSSNFNIGVVSNKKGDNLRLEVSNLGLTSYFRVVIGSGDAPRDKPHPDSLMLAFDTLKKFPEECLYIGDSEVDAIASSLANCNFIMYGSVFQSKDNNRIVESVTDHKDLLKLLNSLV